MVQSLTDRNITFVTRLKRNAVYELLDKRRGRNAQWVVGDQRIRLKNMKTDLRLVDYIDPETGKLYYFLTNSFELKATVIAELYKERWKVGVSSKGHITQSVKVRPRVKDSALVAWEVPRRETKAVEPSDNVFYKENTQHTRPQRTVNADVASLHEIPVAETVYDARRQKELTEMNPMRRYSPAGYQRWHGVKGYVETGEALDTRQRKR